MDRKELVDNIKDHFCPIYSRTVDDKLEASKVALALTERLLVPDKLTVETKAKGIKSYIKKSNELSPETLEKLLDNTLNAINIDIEQIDTYSLIKKVNIERSDRDRVFKINEVDLEKKMREIHRRFDTTDHSGSELVDCYMYLSIDNRKYLAFFVLKGSGTPKVYPKDVSHQLTKAFRSNAEIIVLQAVGVIDPRVVDEAISLAKNYGKYVCIIDGNETARILKAYNKLE